MSEMTDIIVVGAGHNSLTAAAYLAKHGLSVLVLERNDHIGGGVVTEELTVPGFHHDTHSIIHQYIQMNPMIDKDELGLLSKFGLKYLEAPYMFSSVFEDGSIIQMGQDLEMSCASIAVHSERDAKAYRDFIHKTYEILPMVQHALFNPPMPFGGFMALLEQSPLGRELMGDMLGSAYDLALKYFENEKVQMHLLRYAAEAMMGPESKGTGLLLFITAAALHAKNARYPEGGSGHLSLAIQRCIEHYGGKIMLNSSVKRLIMSGDKATGVELDDGRVFHAKKAVLASVHPKNLNDFVGGRLTPEIQADIKNLKPSDYVAFNTHYALKEPLRYKVHPEALANTFGIEIQPANMMELRQMFDEFRYNKLPEHLSVIGCVPSNFDKKRCPEGNAVLYLYMFAPSKLVNGDWDEIKMQVADRMLETYRQIAENLTDDNIIARHVDSPKDMAKHSASFVGGDIMSLGMHLFQFMGRRPTPDLASYRVPGVSGLYLVGPFMHPGGGVMGGGRPVAIRVMADLGMKTDML
ncbi:phytoene desaturase family protein [Ferribacterium limneticum]|uniref:phytoene desaturase family protein n=1 Tax=Ferribacterium limneticum TaxID=76259 RepID=UPI001CFB66F1|nr:NAD(P)/FAD-dependent oxidoreductase [Ferribacterium limneticum]UCV17797.1 NAD(P)/FAD-dependent oxidoreductase [Ferribacterium limneticum]